MRIGIVATLVLVVASSVGCTHADLVLRNGTIVTMDDRFGRVEDMVLRRGGQSGQLWAVHSGSRQLTNVNMAPPTRNVFGKRPAWAA